MNKDTILKEFEEFNKELNIFWGPILLFETLIPFSDHVYHNKFEKIIGDVKKAKEVFSILTLPSEISFVTQERIELLGMILKFLSSRREREVLASMSNADYLAKIKFENPDFLEALEKHQEKYHWMQNSYGQHVYLTLNNFLEFLKEILKESSLEQIKEELKKISNRDEMSSKQEQILKELGLPEQVKKEIEYMKNISLLQDKRKRIILMMLHQYYRFLEEFSERARLEVAVLGYASTDEIPKILENNFNIDLLKKRKEKGIFVAQTGGRFSKFIENEAEELKRLIFKEQTEILESIHGNVASRGDEAIVTGKIKIVLNPRKESIEEDEILVTSMTRPEFVPLMRKARAIITNEGGITSHAAIVAREMNKPCIIGTKNATEVLKNGDEVELRMNHGVVKIIKRKD